MYALPFNFKPKKKGKEFNSFESYFINERIKKKLNNIFIINL